jgi:GT2 family glycosyltransferase
MNIAVILLTLNRSDYSIQVINQNFKNSGYNADCFLIDNGSTDKEFLNVANAYKWHFATWSQSKRGIAAGVNFGLTLTKDYDAVVIMANDILMPENWLLSMVNHSINIPSTGIIGIHCVEELPPLVDGIHKTHTPFGNNLITRSLIDTIGGYNTEYDPYGMQDRDYAERATLAGYTNYYLPNMKSVHIGHDVGENSEYRIMKDNSLNIAQLVWERYQPIYHQQKNLYIPYANISNNK